MRNILFLLLLSFATHAQQVDTINYPIFGNGVTERFTFHLAQPYDLIGCILTSQPITAQATVPAFYYGSIIGDTIGLWVRNVYDLTAPPQPLMYFPRRPPVINCQCYLRQIP